VEARVTAETPLELQHVVARLHTDFDKRLAAGTGSTDEEREKNFLSRALAAFSIHRLAGCSLDEAAAAVVDGGGDFGLDAIFFSAAAATLWLAQSKFDGSGRGQPDLGDVSKFCNGVDALLRGNFAPFAANAAVTKRKAEIEAALKTPELQVRAIVVYSGLAVVSEDRRHSFDQLRHTFSSGSDYLGIATYSLTTVHDWVTDADKAPGVPKLQLTLEKPGWVTEPYETIYGCIRIADLATLWRDHEKRLIAANLRGYKGSTEVNEGIGKTIAEEPQNLFYLNNGLTAYCERLEVENVDRANPDRKRVTVYGFSIVNGAQTLGSIGAHIADPGAAPDGVAFLKIVSLQKCADDRAFAIRITQTTNFQNQISVRDFVALEEEQAAVANGLALSGINYHYKDADDNPTPDATNFTLEEATTALACLEQQSNCDLLSRIVAQRKALWSFEQVYPVESPYRSRYAQLFKSSRSARSIWRAVQVQRVTAEALQTNESGARKDFFVYGKWLVLNAVFLHLHPERGESLTLTPEERAKIIQAAQEYTEVLWTVSQSKGFVSAKAGGGWESPRHFKSVFSAAGDCQTLRSALLAKLAEAAQPAPVNQVPGIVQQ
jgi:hypothetical protein